MRQQGVRYNQIADTLNLSVNTVKSYCRRNGLTVSEDTKIDNYKETCKQCGKPLKQESKRKQKTFCCDKCRYMWWNTHRDYYRKSSAIYHFVCAYCGKTFDSYSNKDRRYCSHACYIRNRFGEMRQ